MKKHQLAVFLKLATFHQNARKITQVCRERKDFAVYCRAVRVLSAHARHVAPDTELLTVLFVAAYL